ncbi:hypothetical protein L4682_005949 [Pseudomonas aeruginosa]|nr:hypothetical protein [Pseudomonas aeruginosa]
MIACTPQQAVRQANVDHVLATSSLENARPSSFLAGKLSDYRDGKITPAQLVAQARSHYGCK